MNTTQRLSNRAQNLSLGAKEGVFAVAARATTAKKAGNNIIDSTLGVAYNDEGKLFTLPTVERLLKDEALIKKSLAYAGILGINEYRDINIKLALKGALEPITSAGRKIESFATHGGTGAIATALYLFSEDAVITGTPCWESYAMLAQTQSLKLETFPLLQKNSEGKFAFNVAGLKQYLDQAKTNETTAILLNHPCQNPTGYTPSSEEWTAITELLRNASEQKPIALILDLAYHEYASNPNDRSFITNIALACPNLPIVIAMSNSKTYGFYGYRTGALIIIHPQQPIENLEDHVRGFLRGVFSNMCHMPQEIITMIESDPNLKQQADAEREHIRQALMSRGEKLIAECRAQDVSVVTSSDGKFAGGFFGFIPVETPEKSLKMGQILEDDNTFFLALDEGLRVAVCSMSESSIEKGVQKIKEKQSLV